MGFGEGGGLIREGWMMGFGQPGRGGLIRGNSMTVFGERLDLIRGNLTLGFGSN